MGGKPQRQAAPAAVHPKRLRSPLSGVHSIAPMRKYVVKLWRERSATGSYFSTARSGGRCIVRNRLTAAVWIAVLALVWPAAANAESGGKALVYGTCCAFSVTVPTGWVIDRRRDRNNGLPAVFYPQGGSWRNSPAVIYLRWTPRDPGSGLQALIRDDEARFRKTSANVEIQRGEPVTTADGKTAAIRYFSGDKWGNHEAVAYLAEKKVFLIIVLTSRTLPAYRDSLGAFRSLVGSYAFVSDDPENATNHFDLIEQIANDASRQPPGSVYDREFAQYFQQHYQLKVGRCFNAAAPSERANFDLLVRVASDGRPLNILSRPSNQVSKCLVRNMEQDRFPKPPWPRFWEHLSMHFVK